MKALSITQPWANAILHLGKRIENREWRGCSYRGPILLHASKSVGTRDDFDASVETCLDIVGRRMARTKAAQLLGVEFRGGRGIHHADGRWQPKADLARGGIVGKANIVGTSSNVELANDDVAWWQGGFALVLADVQAVPFVPCKGALGLWNAPSEVVHMLPDWLVAR